MDTAPYRNAVWFYVGKLYGVVNDEYDYRNVNVFLAPKTKNFIKLTACRPGVVGYRDFLHSSGLSLEEKAHVALLTIESRKQAALLFGLRAIERHYGLAT